MEIENLRVIAERVVDFFFCPDVEGAFSSIPVAGICDRGYNGAVCIFGREEPAIFRRHVASDVIEDVARDRFVLFIFCDLERVEVRDSKLRLVVKHFLEMRYVPVTIDGITMKSAADMVMHTPCGHFAQREQSHFQRVFAVITFGIARGKAREEVESHWARKFRGITEAAFLWVVAAVELLIGGIQNCDIYFVLGWCG